MRLLSLIDQLFLVLENRRQPMHVGGLLVFEVPARHTITTANNKDFVTALFAQIKANHSTPSYPFNQVLHKLTFWKDITDFDINQHFYHIKLKQPLCNDVLTQYVSKRHQIRLDKSYPLWECYLIEGNTSQHSKIPQQFALYIKIHHALLDGVAAMHLLQQSLFTSSQQTTNLPPWSLMSRHISPKSLQLIDQPIMTTIKHAMQMQAKATVPMIKRVATKLRKQQSSKQQMIYDVPTSILNQRISPKRQVITHSYAMARLKSIADTCAVTLNDAMLALCSGALRRYLMQLNELPNKPLIALIPTSMRDDNSTKIKTCKQDENDHSTPHDYRQDMGNHLAFILCNLGTHLSSAKQRLSTISHSMNMGKDFVTNMTQAEFINYATITYGLDGFKLMTEINPKKQFFNLVISNMIGVPQPLYWNGAKLKHIYPASVLLSGLALNITLISYDDKLEFGIVACPQALPKLHQLLMALDAEMACLEQLS